ncbi:MAG TPA: hypothetical protein PKD96_01360 [Candidatus Absconditabacterales bacterium]|nr:hypothetical protein [Candidatus Absconditabacterales bacterium]HMT26927.1 hypothetical protein [Candidatus Absconditabacterales bacterium]
MLQKKQLLLKILEKIKPFWELAEGMVSLLQTDFVDEPMVDSFLAVLTKAIHGIKDEKAKLALQRAVEYVHSMKEKEQVEHEKADQELDAMLSTI